ARGEVHLGCRHPARRRHGVLTHGRRPPLLQRRAHRRGIRHRRGPVDPALVAAGAHARDGERSRVRVVMTPRARWVAFRDFVDGSVELDDVALADVLARIAADPDAWARRACLTTLVRGDLLTDAQLRAIADAHGGKLARFIARVLTS